MTETSWLQNSLEYDRENGIDALAWLPAPNRPSTVAEALEWLEEELPRWLEVVECMADHEVQTNLWEGLLYDLSRLTAAFARAVRSGGLGDVETDGPLDGQRLVAAGHGLLARTSPPESDEGRIEAARRLIAAAEIIERQREEWEAGIRPRKHALERVPGSLSGTQLASKAKLRQIEATGSGADAKVFAQPAQKPTGRPTGGGNREAVGPREIQLEVLDPGLFPDLAAVQRFVESTYTHLSGVTRGLLCDDYVSDMPEALLRDARNGAYFLQLDLEELFAAYVAAKPVRAISATLPDCEDAARARLALTLVDLIPDAHNTWMPERRAAFLTFLGGEQA